MSRATSATIRSAPSASDEITVIPTSVVAVLATVHAARNAVSAARTDSISTGSAGSVSYTHLTLPTICSV